MALVTADHGRRVRNPQIIAHDYQAGGDSSALARLIQRCLRSRESSILDTTYTRVDPRKSGTLSCSATGTMLVDASMAHRPCWL